VISQFVLLLISLLILYFTSRLTIEAYFSFFVKGKFLRYLRKGKTPLQRLTGFYLLEIKPEKGRTLFVTILIYLINSQLLGFPIFIATTICSNLGFINTNASNCINRIVTAYFFIIFQMVFGLAIYIRIKTPDKFK
jgi:hypothetical protein